MTAVSRCVRGLKGIAAFAGIVLSLSVTARAQDTVTARAQDTTQADGFHVGDRIALTVEGPQVISDTVVVRDGLILRLVGLGDIPLAGVKRTDIQKYLTQQISRFIKDPIVHATALVRISVLGQVLRPGFYTVPSDVLLSDVVMRAGGPTGSADLNRSVVKRGSEDVIPEDQVASALASGMTIDQLHIAPGDELVVGEKPNSSFDTVLRVLSVGVPVLSLLLYFSRR
ncbi:MAG TPA: SLBB domain-containing protein [Gemmatimonadaceae bacterium]